MSADKDIPLIEVCKPVRLEGVVQHVVFHNEQNGYTILKMVPEDSRGKLDPVACVGYFPNPRKGSRLQVEGEYVNSKYGRQLKCSHMEEILPATIEDIRLYLSSGVIKCVGPDLARRIVDKFGEDTIRLLDEEPERLREVRGIGPKNLEKIIEAWNGQRSMRDLMLFLQPYGVSAAYAMRIFRSYGAESLHVVRENPFRLAMDIRGVGFATADAIAAKLGFAADHPLRVQAALLYVLQKSCDDGNVFLPEVDAVELTCAQAGTQPEQARSAIAALERDQRIEREQLATGKNGGLVGIYLSRLHHCESKTAFYLQRILRSPKSAAFKDVQESVAKALATMSIQLAPQQMKAVETSAHAKVLVITGGPGTGKTTIIKAVIKVFEQTKARILLAAPTGRAAKRMAEACGRDARTIHRMLEYSPREDCFARNEDHPLECGLLVVDEASMMDTMLFYYLLKALPLGATLVLVGDVHQLPSVGPGNVLGDIIQSKAAPVVELNEIFRQSAKSDIICNAHLINNGQMPLMAGKDKASDFYFIARNDPEEAADLIVDLVKNHVPRRFGYDPINEIQLLTPMHKGAVGAERMNGRLQDALNPHGLEVRRGSRSFRLHDKVMQVRNNYDKDIFNGDIGRITHMNINEKTLSVDFDGVVMPYTFEELDELVPAYAISIHKSQGSEYPAVIIPVMMQHYVLLQRNLIYTGVTRGKKLVILVGEYRALQMAVSNNKTGKRNTWLAQRLKRFEM